MGSGEPQTGSGELRTGSRERWDGVGGALGRGRGSLGRGRGSAGMGSGRLERGRGSTGMGSGETWTGLGERWDEVGGALDWVGERSDGARGGTGTAGRRFCPRCFPPELLPGLGVFVVMRPPVCHWERAHPIGNEAEINPGRREAVWMGQHCSELSFGVRYAGTAASFASASQHPV